MSLPAHHAVEVPVGDSGVTSLIFRSVTLRVRHARVVGYCFRNASPQFRLYNHLPASLSATIKKLTNRSSQSSNNDLADCPLTQHRKGVFVCGALLTLLVWFGAMAQTSSTSKNVLVLYDEQTRLPGLSMMDSSIRSTLNADSSVKTDIYTESLDLSRFQRSG